MTTTQIFRLYDLGLKLFNEESKAKEFVVLIEDLMDKEYRGKRNYLAVKQDFTE